MRSAYRGFFAYEAPCSQSVCRSHLWQDAQFFFHRFSSSPSNGGNCGTPWASSSIDLPFTGKGPNGTGCENRSTSSAGGAAAVAAGAGLGRPPRGGGVSARGRRQRLQQPQIGPALDRSLLIRLRELVRDIDPVAIADLLVARDANDLALVEHVDEEGIAARFLADVQAGGLHFII